MVFLLVAGVHAVSMQLLTQVAAAQSLKVGRAVQHHQVCYFETRMGVSPTETGADTDIAQQVWDIRQIGMQHFGPMQLVVQLQQKEAGPCGCRGPVNVLTGAVEGLSQTQLQSVLPLSLQLQRERAHLLPCLVSQHRARSRRKMC